MKPHDLGSCCNLDAYQNIAGCYMDVQCSFSSSRGLWKILPLMSNILQETLVQYSNGSVHFGWAMVGHIGGIKWGWPTNWMRRPSSWTASTKSWLLSNKTLWPRMFPIGLAEFHLVDISVGQLPVGATWHLQLLSIRYLDHSFTWNCDSSTKDSLVKLYIACTQCDVLVNNLLSRSRTADGIYQHVHCMSQKSWCIYI